MIFLLLLVLASPLQACWCCPKETDAVPPRGRIAERDDTVTRVEVAPRASSTAERVVEDGAALLRRLEVDALVVRWVRGSIIASLSSASVPAEYAWGAQTLEDVTRVVKHFYTLKEAETVRCDLGTNDHDLADRLARATNLGDCEAYLNRPKGPQGYYLLARTKLERANEATSPRLRADFFSAGMHELFMAAELHFPQAVALLETMIRFLPEIDISVDTDVTYKKDATLSLLAQVRMKTIIYTLRRP